MARHIRVPGIVDVVLVSDPAEIRALDDQQKIDRNFIPRGPLVNRLIVGRIRRWFEIMGQLLPSLTPRDDQVRADRQKQLTAALDPAHEPNQGSTPWTDAQIDSLAAYVRGAGGDEAAGITTQEMVGRLFDTQYRADRATWEAAKMIDQFRDGFSPIQIVWQLTGQLRRARDHPRRPRQRRPLDHARHCNRRAWNCSSLGADAGVARIAGSGVVQRGRRPRTVPRAAETGAANRRSAVRDSVRP